MKKRLKFRCWHCQRSYTLLKEIDPDVYNRLRIACPYCQKRGILELNKHLKPADETFRGGDEQPDDTPALIDFEQTFATEPDADEAEGDAHE